MTYLSELRYPVSSQYHPIQGIAGMDKLYPIKKKIPPQPSPQQHLQKKLTPREQVIDLLFKQPGLTSAEIRAELNNKISGDAIKHILRRGMQCSEIRMENINHRYNYFAVKLFEREPENE